MMTDSSNSTNININDVTNIHINHRDLLVVLVLTSIVMVFWFALRPDSGSYDSAAEAPVATHARKTAPEPTEPKRAGYGPWLSIDTGQVSIGTPDTHISEIGDYRISLNVFGYSPPEIEETAPEPGELFDTSKFEKLYKIENRDTSRTFANQVALAYVKNYGQTGLSDVVLQVHSKEDNRVYDMDCKQLEEYVRCTGDNNYGVLIK